MELSQQARMVVLAALLGLVGLALAAFLFLRPHSASTTQSQSTTPATPVTPVSPPEPRPPGRPKTPATGLPVRIAEALNHGQVVVVGLYAPGVELDEEALREAQSGAHRAGAVFVPVAVTTKNVDQLARRFGALRDPAALVLKPPADLSVLLQGFADSDTVAQAAEDAR
jgi:hypothetical protein